MCVTRTLCVCERVYITCVTRTLCVCERVYITCVTRTLCVCVRVYITCVTRTLCVCVRVYTMCLYVYGRKEMFLFNDALKTFYLRLYGVGHMVKDHSENEMKPAAAITWTSLYDYQQGLFSMHHSIDSMAHTTTIVIPVVDHWLELEIGQ